uniref:Uncharacterized protein n=1 Tax=Anguilla anguilla TaxID=7936 RepID=A0A0E9U2R1_ANGAN
MGHSGTRAVPGRAGPQCDWCEILPLFLRWYYRTNWVRTSASLPVF